MEFDQLDQFFAQMPFELIINLCILGILLFGLIFYFGYIKPQRNRQQSSTPTPPSPQPIQTPISMQMPPPPQPTYADGVYEIRLHDGQRTRAKEMIAILRDSQDERLIVELDGIGYRSLVQHPAVKARFTELMRELAETIAKPDERPASKPAAPPAAEMDDLSLEMPDIDTLSTLPPAAPLPPVAWQDTTSTLQPPTSAKKGQAKPDAEPIPTLNLAEAIEIYLQQKLIHHPDYAHRAIHVHAAIHGGVVIQVDDAYFETVNDITDPQIRAFMAQTIEEWQAQQ